MATAAVQQQMQHTWPIASLPPSHPHSQLHPQGSFTYSSPSNPNSTSNPNSISYASTPQPALPERNTLDLTRPLLLNILTHFSHLLPTAFPAGALSPTHPVQLIVHGGACTLLHPNLSLLTGAVPEKLKLPQRTSTRDVDVIFRAFVREWEAWGVQQGLGRGRGEEARERLGRCVVETGRVFGLGKDWMNSDADVALPMATDPTGAPYDPISTAALQPNNLDLHTIFTSPNRLLVLVSVTPFWAVALKLVRYAKWDPGDICLLLRNGTLLSHTKWTPEALEDWLKQHCWAMGYASYDHTRRTLMRSRIQHAVSLVHAWEAEVDAGGGGNGFGAGRMGMGAEGEGRGRSRSVHVSAEGAMGGGEVVGGTAGWDSTWMHLNGHNGFNNFPAAAPPPPMLFAQDPSPANANSSSISNPHNHTRNSSPNPTTILSRSARSKSRARSRNASRNPSPQPPHFTSAYSIPPQDPVMEPFIPPDPDDFEAEERARGAREGGWFSQQQGGWHDKQHQHQQQGWQDKQRGWQDKQGGWQDKQWESQDKQAGWQDKQQAGWQDNHRYDNQQHQQPEWHALNPHHNPVRPQSVSRHGSGDTLEGSRHGSLDDSWVNIDDKWMNMNGMSLGDSGNGMIRGGGEGRAGKTQHRRRTSGVSPNPNHNTTYPGAAAPYSVAANSWYDQTIEHRRSQEEFDRGLSTMLMGRTGAYSNGPQAAAAGAAAPTSQSRKKKDKQVDKARNRDRVAKWLPTTRGLADFSSSSSSSASPNSDVYSLSSDEEGAARRAGQAGASQWQLYSQRGPGQGQGQGQGPGQFLAPPMGKGRSSSKSRSSSPQPKKRPPPLPLSPIPQVVMPTTTTQPLAVGHRTYPSQGYGGGPSVTQADMYRQQQQQQYHVSPPQQHGPPPPQGYYRNPYHQPPQQMVQPQMYQQQRSVHQQPPLAQQPATNTLGLY